MVVEMIYTVDHQSPVDTSPAPWIIQCFDECATAFVRTAADVGDTVDCATPTAPEQCLSVVCVLSCPGCRNQLQNECWQMCAAEATQNVLIALHHK